MGFAPSVATPIAVVPSGDTSGVADQANLQAAFDQAELDGVPVALRGHYYHNDRLYIDSVTVMGDGPTVLEATNPALMVTFLRGTKPALIGVTFKTNQTARGGFNSNAIVVGGGAGGTDGALVQDCKVLGSNGDGVHISSGSHHCRIIGNHIEVIYDGIHVEEASHHLVIANNVINGNSGVGNEGIGIDSFDVDTDYCYDIAVTGNVIDGTTTGIQVNGGKRVTVTGNSISNILHAGIIVQGTGAVPTGTRASKTVTVTGNALYNTSTDASQGAIQVSGRNGDKVSRVVIAHNAIELGNFGGVALSTFTEYVTIMGNTMTDIKGAAGVAVIGSSYPTITHNTVDGADKQGVQVDATTTGRIMIERNFLKDVNRSGTASNDAIFVSPASAATRIDINFNYHINPGGYVLDRFIECLNDNILWCEGNQTTSGKTIFLGSGNLRKANPGLRNDFGSVPPAAGTWAVGDRFWNGIPAVGQPMGWICTVAGTPGTWVAMPNL